MIDIAEIKLTLKNVIEGITDTPVINANQNAPRPIDDYISLLLFNSGQIGQASKTGADEITGEITVTTHKDISISLQCISVDGFQILEQLKSEIYTEKSLETLKNCDIALVNVGDVKDISGNIGSGDIEMRAGVDLFIRVADVRTENVGIIEQVTGTGTIKDIEGNAVSDFDYSVDAS